MAKYSSEDIAREHLAEAWGEAPTESRLENVLTAIRMERGRQDVKFGPVGTCASLVMSDLQKLAILSEEFAEALVEHFLIVNRSVNDHETDDLRIELVQVAAVAVAWAESLQGVR